MKCTHLILGPGEVHGGLAAHGGVHRREQGGGHLHIGDAALIGGGGKARQVSCYAAAQGNDQVAAGEACGQEGLLQDGTTRQWTGPEATA